MPKEFVKVATTSEVSLGEVKLVELEGERILLTNLEGEYYAVEEVCPHAGGPLSEGFLEDSRVECPWHGSHFNVKSGEVLSPPADRGLKVYPVRVEGGDILIGPVG